MAALDRQPRRRQRSIAGAIAAASAIYAAGQILFVQPAPLRTPARSSVAARRALQFDRSNVIDRTEEDLIGTTLTIKSSVFGFPDFSSLIDLQDDGTVKYYGGMVSKEPGNWCVVKGDPEEGERPDDLYIEFTQPLTDTYVKAFNIDGETAIWRGKLSMGKSAKGVKVDGGIVVSKNSDDKLVREGVFTAAAEDQKAIDATRKKNRDAFERALTTPKAESTGFKTPARIAGAKPIRSQRMLKSGERKKIGKLEEDIDLEDD